MGPGRPQERSELPHRYRYAPRVDADINPRQLRRLTSQTATARIDRQHGTFGAHYLAGQKPHRFRHAQQAIVEGQRGLARQRSTPPATHGPPPDTDMSRPRPA